VADSQAEDYPADFDDADEGMGDGDGDGDGGGGSDFRLVYSGAAMEYLMTDLSPACRYRFRVRRLGVEGQPPSGWSEVLILETDATDSKHRIDFDDITVFEVLGEGAFSVVYRGEHQQRQVAVKRLKYQHLNEELVSKFSIEVAILSRVRHRNVVAFVGAVTEQPNLCVVMEYMDAGSLHQAIHKQNLVLPLPRLLQVAMDVAQGCHYLHRQKPMIIHRDLKSQNILLTAQGVAKIADFGLSRFFQQDVASMTGQVGTPGWTAPEVYKHNSYNHKVDVYSFAVVLAECLTCEKPYAGMDAMQIAFATVYRNKRPALPTSTPAPLEKLIKLCWDTEQRKRPPFSRIIDQLRAVERTTTGVSKSVDRARGTADLRETSQEGPGGRTLSAGVQGRSGASRPKGSATAKVDTGRGDRSGSPDRAGRLRRAAQAGSNMQRAAATLGGSAAAGVSAAGGASHNGAERCGVADVVAVSALTIETGAASNRYGACNSGRAASLSTDPSPLTRQPSAARQMRESAR
jgi:tRNA A-37 threonylcarbamoyl transferase component Bud32